MRWFAAICERLNTNSLGKRAMGVAGSSEPLWVPPYESPTWDMWGHVPPGLKPSQYNVNDFYVNSAFPTSKMNNNGPFAGQQNSVMEIE